MRCLHLGNTKQRCRQSHGNPQGTFALFYACNPSHQVALPCHLQNVTWVSDSHYKISRLQVSCYTLPFTYFTVDLPGLVCSSTHSTICGAQSKQTEGQRQRWVPLAIQAACRPVPMEIVQAWPAHLSMKALWPKDTQSWSRNQIDPSVRLLVFQIRNTQLILCCPHRKSFERQNEDIFLTKGEKEKE